MFRLEFFVDDKHLAKVMHAVGGIAMNLNVQPVSNAKQERGGTVKPKYQGNSLVEQASNWAAKYGEFTRADIKEFLKETGAPNAAISTLLTGMRNRGIIKIKGKPKGPGYPAVYQVINGAE